MLLRQPIIKLPDPTSPGPESPLERNPLSPMGWKKREAEGVGLGIVVALETSDSSRRSPRTKSVAVPIAVAWPKAEHEHSWRYSACPGESRHGPFFCGSPPSPRGKNDGRISPVADFLSNCYLCKKNLNGKDIYMYRGEKAFCSSECRYQQIMSDEFQEKCGSEACRPTSDMFSTSYTDDWLFFTGIAAA